MDVKEEQVASTSGTEQVVLVLCGLIGSGKSTFAKALQHNFPDFIRCNQDEMGSRQEVEQLAISSLQKGLSVCIDRTNIDQDQRRHWVEIAHMFPGTHKWALVFNTSKEVCSERLATRKNHPTIKTHEQALEVLDRFSWQYRPPAYSEGFDRILTLADGARGFDKQDIANLLDHIRDEVPPTPDDFPVPYRGHPEYRGGYRKLDYRQSGQSFHGYPGYDNDQARGQPYRAHRGSNGHGRGAPYYVRGQSPTHGNGVRARTGYRGQPRSWQDDDLHSKFMRGSPEQQASRTSSESAFRSPSQGHSPASQGHSPASQAPTQSSASPQEGDVADEVVYLDVE